MVRRQVSLYAPEPYRSRIDRVRKKIDPLQHGLIPAHVTLCREDEVHSWERLTSDLKSANIPQISLAFGKPAQLEDGCILLPCTRGQSSFRALRERLLESRRQKPRDSRPHITLLHPRNSMGFDVNLEELEKVAMSGFITFTTINVIQQIDGGPWKVMNEFSMHSDDV